MSKININRKDLYFHHDSEHEDRTRNRLIEISKLGMEEVGIAEFGIRGIMSGLYIEKVWRYGNKDWNEYIDWVKSLIEEKKVK